MKAILLSLLATLIMAKVVPFEQNVMKEIFMGKKPALLLFSSTNEASEAAREEFTKLSEKGVSYILTTVGEDKEETFNRLTEFLGVDTQNLPQVIYIQKQTIKYLFEADITSENLYQFVQNIKKGKVRQYLKSDPIPENNDGPVKIAVGKNYKQLVSNTQKQVLVFMYLPWLSKTKEFEPVYDIIAGALAVNPNIMFVKIDNFRNQITEKNVKGMPGLRLYRKDKSNEPVDFQGDLNLKEVVDWLKEKTEYQWVDFETEEVIEPQKIEQL